MATVSTTSCLTQKPPIYALIGVWSKGGLTYYVQRSQQMENYPGVWSLFSERFDPNECDPLDREDVTAIFERMSRSRLGAVPLMVRRLISARARYNDALGCHISLWMYEVELAHEPKLNAEFYSDGAWLTNDEFRERASAVPCGMCTRMLSDYRMRRREISESLVAIASAVEYAADE